MFFRSSSLLSSRSPAADLYPEAGRWAGDMSVTDDRVTIQSLDFYCGSRSVRWSPGAFARSSTSLFRNGQRIGTVHADGTVKLELWDPSFHDRYPNRRFVALFAAGAAGGPAAQNGRQSSRQELTQSEIAEMRPEGSACKFAQALA